MIVLDASSTIELLTGSRLGRLVATRISPPDETLHAPHLLDLEVAQALRRYVAGGAVAPARAEIALTDLADLDLERYPHNLFLPRIWALRANLTAYDAAYVALAEALGCPLLTCDAKLARAPEARASFELLGP